MYKVVILKNYTVKVMKIRVISLRTSKKNFISENNNFFYFFSPFKFIKPGRYLAFIFHGTKSSHINVIRKMIIQPVGGATRCHRRPTLAAACCAR
jgi:hypothetical protein